MEQKNRTVLVIAIAITVIAAVFVSFGLPALTSHPPEVLLPDLEQEELSGQELLSVDVTPQTVQSVIATLARPDRYYREMTVTLSWSGGSGSASDLVRIWADGDYIKSVTLSGNSIQHRLIGPGKLFLWYDGELTWTQRNAGEDAADLIQRIPTYEDVLELSPEVITDAGYVNKNGKACVYVEVNETDRIQRYWIEVATGLLCAAETEEQGAVVYAVQENTLSGLPDDKTAFMLPDGTVLHDPSAAAQAEHSGNG